MTTDGQAVKVKQGQDLMRSQLLGSIPSPNPRRMEASRYAPSQGDMISSMSIPTLHHGSNAYKIGQRKRIESLEEELRLLRIENEKNVRPPIIS